MTRELITDILKLARSRKTLSARASCLLKGLIFFPFLLKSAAGSKGRDKNLAAAGQAGDDIYPIF